MNIRERKSHLISWLAELKNESLINRIEELKAESQADLPKEIISLLDTSNSVQAADLVAHTNTQDLLSK